MICIIICIEEVGVFLIFVDFCISCFEVTLVGAFLSFIKFISWLHDRFMWMVREIFHAMFEINKIRLCWVIHVATEMYSEILKIIASLSSGVHDYTNPVIEGSSI